jgi:fatty-acyl-CoA synthase
MMDVPLSLNSLLERAGTLFAGSTIVSRLPDKSLRATATASTTTARALASALRKLGLRKGDAWPRCAGTTTHRSATSAFRRPAA